MWLKYLGDRPVRAAEGGPTWRPQDEHDVGDMDLSGYPEALFERIYPLADVVAELPPTPPPNPRRGRGSPTPPDAGESNSDPANTETVESATEEPVTTEGAPNAPEEAR